MSRKDEFLKVAGKLAGKFGAANVTRRQIAGEVDCSEALVSHYLGGRDEMRKAIKLYVKRNGIKEPADAQAIGKTLRKQTVKRVSKTKPASVKAKPVRKVAKPVITKAASPVKPAKKTAARKPIAPPALPAL